MILTSSIFHPKISAKNTLEMLSEGIKNEKFPGGACPQIPLDGALTRVIPTPPIIIFSPYILLITTVGKFPS